MLRQISAAALALVTAGALVACGGSESSGGAELQLFGASSTRVINDELSTLAAELDPPLEIAYNNDGSGSLVTQLNEGAPADVLITANTSTMEQAVADGTVSDPQELATNSMVMVVPSGNPASIESVEELDEDINLVLCDPSVPCGDVSAQLQELTGLSLHPVSLEGAVGDVLGKVANGEADAGWVYRTDAAASDDVEMIDIPQAEHVPNTLWVAPVTDIEQTTALVDLILSPEVAAVLEESGFTPAT